jgi:hypothetical protein
MPPASRRRPAPLYRLGADPAAPGGPMPPGWTRGEGRGLLPWPAWAVGSAPARGAAGSTARRGCGPWAGRLWTAGREARGARRAGAAAHGGAGGPGGARAAAAAAAAGARRR